ncbi:glycosyltransferase involved in cell wall biosynthesis/GT2 family glycosyltransferase [Methylobacterium sp. BE186]|uniref:glycosyltransferase n=1 Tax=Methylobacterium sp. BE186 TaxID=2817715 RepID=UPI002860ACD2|nr:glycosyltransferase [Methylobacterium sp. BE186]MDR7038324.1 glycosyltransferase involved in cell wall biosynthesis/GT2 family glycosyltransferase [Methylobacterium sp. BE186]
MISVVINTNGRVNFIKRTLRSLRFQTYDRFEVCVICGPTQDGTVEWVSRFADIKIALCPDRNLSKSRNIGIALASGEVVAFIDDDAVPEPEWLSDLAHAYRDSDVAAAGGHVYDHTGIGFQARYVTTDRLARPRENWAGPAQHLNFPFSPAHPHLLGTNCSFRREALLSIGGFDEEYEYFLDETDVCCRLNDAGGTIAQLSNAFVHHKYAPSESRDVKRIVRNWYPLIKNRVYFAIKNAQCHHSLRDAVSAGLADASSWERGIKAAIAEGHYSQEDLERFRQEADAAIADGLERARAERKILSSETLASHAADFVPFATILPPAKRRKICFVTQDYPPGQNGGIARYVHQLARSLGAAGHHVHVLTKARGIESVDFEDDVWVHRLAIKHHSHTGANLIGSLPIPGHIWSYSRTMLDAVTAINARSSVDAVYCPLWDCEAIAFVTESSFPTIVALQTTMKFWLESQPQRRADPAWMATFGDPIIAMERLLLDRATILHSISRAIARDIEGAYDISLPADRVGFVPLGLEDWSAEVRAERSDASPQLRILFVGRLESRKGVDVLLKTVPRLLARFPDIRIDIVGDDTIPRSDGTTYKDEFLANGLDPTSKGRIVFHGRVDEDELRRKYRSCDIFVAPSKYESFGLIFLEAMMFGKPVVGCDVGGIPEVVTHDESGILVQVGDTAALEEAIARLINDPDLRARMGAAARRDYERRFSDAAMRDGVLAMIDAISIKTDPGADVASDGLGYQQYLAGER